MDLQQALERYIHYPRSSQACFDLAIAYKELNQPSSAISFFMKSAELSSDVNIQYEALLQITMLLLNLEHRNGLAKNTARHAIALLPQRSEAYFVMNTICEKVAHWLDMYMFSNIAIQHSEPGRPILGLDWPGKDVFLFQKAVASWWMDRPEESISTMRKVLVSELPEAYKRTARSNIESLTPLLRGTENDYIKEFKHLLKVQFKGCEHIERNFSETYQDLFVLMCTAGKSNGSFVEIGSAHPEYHSNTVLLERNYNWKGISVDIDSEMFRDWKTRTALTYCVDATTVDWSEILTQPHYDYLQVDCEPPLHSLQALLNIPLTSYSFSVITFEHDRYADTSDFVMEKSREYLKAAGYELVIPNVSPEETRPYEDWWVHPAYVSKEVIDRLRQPLRTVNDVKHCILNFD